MEKPKHTLSTLKICLYAFLISFLLVVITAPSILSTSTGTQLLSYLLSQRLNLDVKISQLKLSWLSSQSAEGVNIEDKRHALTTNAKGIENTSSLLSMLFKKDHIGLTQIDHLDIVISESKESSSESIKEHKSQSTALGASSILQHIFIKDGSIRLKKASQSAAINHMQLNLQIAKDKIILSSKGTSVANNVEGFFDVFCSINRFNFDIQGHINASMLPFAIFDELLSLDQLLEATLGPTLNANSAFHITDDKLNCALELISAQFKASLHTTSTSEYVSLEKPAVVSLTITKESLSALGKQISALENILLTQSGSLQLFLDELKVPYVKKNLDFDKASYKTRLFTSSLHLLLASTQKPLIINASTLSSASSALASQLQLNLKSSLNYNQKNPSFINASIAVSDPLDHRSIDTIQAKVTKLPTIILETFSQKSLASVDYIGETVDVNITTKNPGVTPTFALQMYTPLISVDNLEIDAYAEGITLKEPCTVVYKAPKKLFKDLIKPSGISLEELGTLRLTLHEAVLPEKTFSKEGFLGASLTASLQAEDIVFSSPYTFGKCKLKNSKIELVAPSLKKCDVKTSLALAFIDSHTIQQDVFGSMQPITGVAVIEKLTKKNLTIPYLNIVAGNEKATLNLSCAFTENLRKFAFLEPLLINFNVSSELLNHLLSVSSQETAFVIPSPLQLQLNSEPFYLQEHFSKKLRLNSSISIPRINVIDKIYGKEFSIEKTQCILKGDGSNTTLEASLSSEIQTKNMLRDPGIINCQFVSKHFDTTGFLNKPWEVTSNFSHIPSGLFDVALGLNSNFSILLGPEFNTSMTTQFQEQQFHMTGAFQSKALMFNYDITSSDDMLEVNTPIQGVISLEKDSYSAIESLVSKNIVSKQTFALMQPADVAFKINQLRWLKQSVSTQRTSLLDQLLVSVSEHLKRSLLDISLQSKNIAIVCQETSQSAYLNNVSLECTKNQGLTPFVLNIRSDVASGKDQTHPGRLMSTLQLQNISNEVKKNVISTKIEGSLTQFPSLLLDMGFQLTGLGKIPPSVILGNTVSSSFSAKFENTQGTLSADIQAEQAEGNLQASTNHGVLKLSQPLKAKINITPKLTDYFFKNINLNISKTSGPLSLVIDHRGCYIPFDPYDFSSIQVRNGSIDLGEITCTNTGNPQDVGSFFKLKLSSKDSIDLWFTPINFSLSNGVMYVDRTEVLYNKAYEIAFWGKLDIAKNNASMTLGLTEQSLRKGLGIRGLPRSFVLQLPMEGPIHDVKINKEIAATRLALFLAKTSGATNYGGLWGGIASALSDFANDQTTVPPANPPFPWEGKLSLFEEENKSKSEVNIIR